MLCLRSGLRWLLCYAMSGGFWITTESGTPITTENGLIIVTEGGAAPPTPPAPALLNILPAYAYQQYAPNEDIQAFFSAENAAQQSYLDWFNDTPLSVYTSPNINGALLDWIANGIYGMARPVFSSPVVVHFRGAVNTVPVNTLAVNRLQRIASDSIVTVATDDYYKRVLTWWFYVGDGRMFDIGLLRLKVARFIYGVNGTDVTLSQAQTVHIQPAMVMPPPAPVLSSVSGGSLLTTSYAVAQTYVSPFGETTGGGIAMIDIASDYVVSAASPPLANGAVEYNVYASAPVNQVALGGINFLPVNHAAVNVNPIGTDRYLLTKQNPTPITIGTAWTEPDTGLVMGAALPGSNTSNTPVGIIITVPSGTAATYLQQALEAGTLAFPFMLDAQVVMS